MSERRNFKNNQEDTIFPKNSYKSNLPTVQRLKKNHNKIPNPLILTKIHWQKHTHKKKKKFSGFQCSYPKKTDYFQRLRLYQMRFFNLLLYSKPNLKLNHPSNS